MDVEQLAAGLFGKIKEFVGQRLNALEQRLVEVERRPAPERGEKGLDGKDGKDAEPLPLSAVAALVHEAVAELPPAKDGRDGVDGKDGESIRGEKGEDGASVSEDAVREMVDAAVAAVPTPKDGADGKDGVDGRDGNLAALHVLGMVDGAKRYDRGVWAAHAGGLIFSTRATDPLDGRTPVEAGWLVLLNGLAEETETIADEGRTITRTTRYTDGTVLDRVLKTALVLDRGIFRQEELAAYSKGDSVTSGGSTWIAQRGENLGRPGHPDSGWRLSTKAGRDGKDGKDGEKGDRGRDLTR